MSAPPTCRNLQKKAKKASYEREKAYMDSIRGLGNVTGDYVGDGQVTVCQLPTPLRFLCSLICQNSIFILYLRNSEL